MSPLADLMKLLGEDLSGTLYPEKLVAFLQKLPRDAPIQATISNTGQQWYLCLSLSDLK